MEKKIVNVPLSQIKPMEEFSEEDLHWHIVARIQLNLQNTGHPYHHLTADGTVVDADPTLEHLVSLLRQAKSAVPVNRLFYGFDPFEGK